MNTKREKYMYLKEITLENFRNYTAGQSLFSQGTNVIFGPNACGKTNVLEAIYLLSTSKSHRGAKERELIKYEKERGFVKITYFSRGRQQQTEVKISQNRKQFMVNKTPIKKTSELIGRLYSVLFCPEDLKLVKGAPKERRRMLDLGIIKVRPAYLHRLLKYNKIVEQKNNLLRTNPENPNIWVWNEQLAESGASICRFRAAYLQELSQYAAKHIEQISGEKMELEYKSIGTGKQTVTEIKENILLSIEKNKEREARFKQSLVGPHRDDFNILINGREARYFCSQGQIRSCLLAIRLAEVDLIKKETGETPILLLDDALSELDSKRQEYVLREFNGLQIIITSAEIEKYEKINNINLINVKDIRKEDG